MNDNNELKILFDACFEQSPDRQKEIIQNSQFSDEIKRQVQKLLAIDVEGMELTSTLIENVQQNLNIQPLHKGMKIESYVLLKSLGKGGQGEVWLAERDQGDFSHQVAIKFLKPLYNQNELDRFNNERELLAQLKHNNIAQLLAGGQLPDKRPYMILEYIEGMPLLEYCEKNNYTIKQYLICFLQICDAVSYAHSHLVIHRDIKPSNIIVNQAGVVKLLDFGIAKVIDNHVKDAQTEPIMTLAYSSPEQIKGAGISTATDIYTLGLVLYEMLTGHRAQTFSSESPIEMMHEITDKIPPLPSQIKGLLGKPRQYSHKKLSGDLDNLILMALRKEPHRRYATVATMAKDIENYLDGMPLLATGDSLWYKSKKLVYRNPSLSALSLLTLIFLITLPIVLYHSKIQINKQRELEKLAKLEAQNQSLIAKRTTDFLYNILESASPLASNGKAIDLDDVLQTAERQLAYGLDKQTTLKGHLLIKLAGIYHHLGNNDKSITFYQQALTIFTHTADKQQQLKVLGQLAITYRDKGEIQKSNNYRDKAMALSHEVTDPFELGWYQARMATLWFYANKKAKIRESTPKTLSMLAQNNITDAELLGRLYNGLSLSFNNVDNIKALEYNAKALAYAKSLHGEMHPKYQNRLLNKAKILMRLERYDQAEVVLLQAKSDAEKLYTVRHPDYARVIAELATFYHDKGRFSQAENLYLEAKNIAAKTNGKNSTTYVYQTNNLGFLYEDKGDYVKAEQYYRESLGIRQKTYSDNALLIAYSMSNLARLLAKIDQYNKSQDYIDQIRPVFILNNKSMLLIDIIQIAIDLGSKPSSIQCKATLDAIQKILPKVQKQSAKSWRRMYNELWLGQMASTCKDHQLANSLLQAAVEKSATIYANHSEGQKRIHHLAKKY